VWRVEWETNLFARAGAPIDDAKGTFLPLIGFRSVWRIIWLGNLRFRNRDGERVCFRDVLSLQDTCPFFVSRGLRWVAFLEVLLVVLTAFHHACWVAIDHDVFCALNAAGMQGPVGNTWLA
jgi:hypothetical protein